MAAWQHGSMAAWQHGSTVVEHLTHPLEVEGLSQSAAAGSTFLVKTKLILDDSHSFKPLYLFSIFYLIKCFTLFKAQ
jgi:hypothetical protein